MISHLSNKVRYIPRLINHFLLELSSKDNLNDLISPLFKAFIKGSNAAVNLYFSNSPFVGDFPNISKHVVR